jgi:hypothetical protein
MVRWCRKGHRRGERGSVTAETAVVLPVVAVFVLCLCWLLTLAMTQVRLVDAARDGARALARGEAREDVAEHVRRTAPGSGIEMSTDERFATVSVSAEAHPPDWLLVPLPAVSLRAESAVLREDSDGGP